MKDNPEITKECIENIRKHFLYSMYIFSSPAILLEHFPWISSYLNKANLSPSSFITLIDALIDFMKIEYQYVEPTFFNIPHIDKLEIIKATRIQLKLRKKIMRSTYLHKMQQEYRNHVSRASVDV